MNQAKCKHDGLLVYTACYMINSIVGRIKCHCKMIIYNFRVIANVGKVFTLILILKEWLHIS